MNEEQKKVLYALVGLALEKKGGSDEGEETTRLPYLELTDGKKIYHHTDISKIYADDRNGVWIATLSEGLLYWNKDIIRLNTINNSLYFISGDIASTLLYQMMFMIYNNDLGEEFHEKLNGWLRDIRAQRDTPFTLVVAGDFKRGKSTFINALLGEEVVPTDVTTETVTLNRISYGLYLFNFSFAVISEESFQKSHIIFLSICKNTLSHFYIFNLL